MTYSMQLPIAIIKNYSGKTANDIHSWIDKISYGLSKTIDVEVEDKIYFINTYTYPQLSVIKKLLSQSGKYTESEINEIISATAQLPGYRDSR